jgi:DsbC/DsbD-like thiol-disulfide interchange protein
VKAVTLLWPAPERFPDGAGGHSIGYMGDIIFPLRVIPTDAARPASVHLKLAYAVCANICVPAEANLQLSLTGDGTEDTAIEKAEMRVPRSVAIGAGKGLAILSVRREAMALCIA